ncbi:sugar phosphate isomerase/epimerase [Nonomuraea sp. NPDC049695]|uniref:sugar phosphate isomerase/epimerase family protein n=1 Tax=Nonomuraea sp. NPDC049695 TaxID=3154734 RepID=UPI00342174CC
MTQFGNPESRAAPVVIQPRDPYFEDVIRLAEQEHLGIELVHLAHPGVLSTLTHDELDALAVSMRKVPGPVHVHGAFFDLYVHSPDPDVAAIARLRVQQSVAAAERVGAELVVFHTNFLPCTTLPEYTEWWLEANIPFWEAVAAGTDVPILIENMWDPDPHLLLALTDAVPEIGICLDIGHAHVFGDVPLAEWFSELSGRIRYLHVSDNDGTTDSGGPPGDGDVDWRAFTALAAAHTPKVPVMVGVDGGYAGVTEALRRMNERGIHPFPVPEAPTGKEMPR